MPLNATIHEQQLSSSSLFSANSPISKVIVPHSENDMTTPNQLNVTIAMSHLNKVGNDGSGNHANTTNLAESADQGQVHPLDQHHHSAQQLLDYSNPPLSLDDQPPFDEYSLSI